MMESKHILLLEDEPQGIQFIQKALADLDLEISICQTIDQAKQAVEANELDLAILDVNLKDKESGIEMGEWLDDHTDIPFIYLTGFSDKITHRSIQKTNPHSYLIKPVNARKLIIDVQEALSIEKQISNHAALDHSYKSLAIKVNGHRAVIDQEDILYIEAEGNYSKVVTGEKEYIASKTIKSISTLLNPHHFVRIHRAYCVNTKMIEFINRERVKLDNGHVLPIGRTYQKEIIDRFELI